MLDKPLKSALLIALASAFSLWLIHLYGLAFDRELTRFGIYPLQLFSLPGILLAPLVHSGFEHLLANSLPLILLSTMLLYGYPRSRYRVLAVIWLVSGTGVWLFARSSYHFGASGITHGIFFYLFISGILRRDKRSMAILMIVFFMYGGMLMGILPSLESTSFEYHAFGALGGSLSALLYRHHDPLPVSKSYSWEKEDSEPQEGDNIGDEWKRDYEWDDKQGWHRQDKDP